MIATRRSTALLLAILAALLGSLVAGSTPGRAAAGAPGPLLGVASAREEATAPARLTALRAGWAYDWSATPPRGGVPPWVPMLWGAGSVTAPALRTLTRRAHAGEVHDLLGFNEPDLAGQSDMTPAQAAALWPSLQRTGLTLGSPAPAVAGDGWLARFMALVRTRHLRVDFIALHEYPDVTAPGAVAALRAQLITVHRAYHRPIWITELGALDLRAWGEPMAHRLTPAAVTRFMRGTVAMLRGLPFVQRVAWFTDVCRAADCRDSALLTGDGRPTAAGRAFRALAG